MSTFLWDSIAFGPINSRRLGQSLGVNLLPTDAKICSFDCLYCECGWTLEQSLNARSYPSVETILQAIEHKLAAVKSSNTSVDSITFSGNGEPTLHPQFDKIIDRLLPLRDKYYPQAVISVLSNATQLNRSEVRQALKRIENPILKLDAGSQSMLDTLNKPTIAVHIDEIVEHLCSFEGKLVIQSMFLSGEQEGSSFDNSQDPNFSAWLAAVGKIKPKRVMIYSLDRETPALNLHKFSREKLHSIAECVRAIGIKAEIY